MMKQRRTTLLQYGGIIAALVAVGVLHAWFWGSYMGGQREEVDRKRRQVTNLQREVESKKREKADSDRKATEFHSALMTREKELDSYGDFLPSVRTKPLVIKEILSLIEELGIRIWKIENTPMVQNEGCFTFNFSLKLEGPYKSFKLFLAQIYKSERIFRIKKFDISTFDNDKHNMEAFIEFQTYFAGT